MEIKPVGRNILVEKEKVESNMEGGIYLPDSANDNQSFEAVIKAVGSEGLRDEDGLIEFNVKVGDKVLLSKYEGNEVKVGEEELMFVTENDILAII